MKCMEWFDPEQKSIVLGSGKVSTHKDEEESREESGVEGIKKTTGLVKAQRLNESALSTL